MQRVLNIHESLSRRRMICSSPTSYPPLSRPQVVSLPVSCRQCFGSVSGSGLDTDSIRSVDPDPDLHSESGSRSVSRRAKMTHKNRKSEEISCFEVDFWGLKASPV
jgi:hypothetical protein